MTEKVNLYLANTETYSTLFKHVEHNHKKSKKLLGGYEKILKNKFDELNNLTNELDRIKREKSVLE
jgi:hypothetical protein